MDYQTEDTERAAVDGNTPPAARGAEGPTWSEGYWARVAGWPLHADASEPYRRGYLARRLLEGGSRA